MKQDDGGSEPDSGGSPDGATACTAAGGSCVPTGPGRCPSNNVGDPALYSCNGELGIECCLANMDKPDAAAGRDGGSTKDCAAAGGKCVGVYPGSCPSYVYGDYNCGGGGGGVGAVCCLPGNGRDGG